MGIDEVSRVVGHLGQRPATGFILLPTDQRTLMLVNVLPAENLFSRY